MTDKKNLKVWYYYLALSTMEVKFFEKRNT